MSSQAVRSNPDVVEAEERLAQETEEAPNAQASGHEDRVSAIRATEAPLPTITDRWGNKIVFRGYGAGEYYRLSDQPAWLLDSLQQEREGYGST